MQNNYYHAFVRVVCLALVVALAPFQNLTINAQRSEAQFEHIAPGIEYAHLVRSHAEREEGEGPWQIHVLRIDLTRARLQFGRALDEAVGLETVSSLAFRYGAVAATNAGYFRTTGTFRGESVGTFMLNRRILSEPHNDRSAVGLLPDRKGLIFGHLKFNGRVLAGREEHKVYGINRPLASDELVIFTPEFHRTTLTSADGVEAIIRKNKVVEVRDHSGSSSIPDDGYVISASGDSRTWVLGHLRRGKRIKVITSLEPIEKGTSEIWEQAEAITAGGPQLIKDARVAITNEVEKIAPAFVTDRHPRTAIARLKSGQVLLLAVDGRQPGVSVGMTLPGLAELLLEFGAVEAINLDGGGSTTMVVKGKVVNKPSDQTGERPVSDAILIYPRPQ